MISDSARTVTPRHRDRLLKASFVRARWWQLPSFIWLSVEIARGRDSYADQFLAHPWSLSNLLERAYMLDNFLHSSAYFIEAAGRRAGVVWLIDRPGYIYVYSIGLLPEFQRGTLGMQAARFVVDYSKQRNQVWGAGSVAVKNRPVRMLMAAFKGHPLGLSTTTLTLLGDGGASSMLKIQLKPLMTAAAKVAWRRWRLYEVEQVGGREALHIGAHLLENLYRGEYVAVFQEGQEIGFAFVRHNAGETEIGLFTSTAYWSDAKTACIINAIEAAFGFVARRLTLTQSHANTLSGAGGFRFERRRDEERYYIVFRRD